ncbi:HAD superfamily hydrolase (TIGR01549 family) [Natranaerovirga hydrolytica]|uniref:HAD superfamily hydrolase (TIGR01549 family) n=1 Tax=Natranaerovirga hydrolytica TaxID=680378 RepID=A0A4R1N6C7_9FIRM|nr:HAD family hydrolase [Natranaerovirga hydrolytica]TCK98183.1 HAD superfamily hydrolase (TIGR01549 family) [Natranaerovirga hydrolytica]
MKTFKYIFFDCMETIVDLYQLPTYSDYARWMFYDSGVEHHWKSFEEFFYYYNKGKSDLLEHYTDEKEYEVFEIIQHILKNKKTLNAIQKKDIANALYENYWKTYTSQCYVRDTVKKALMDLSKKYTLVVVSNFKISNGIEELLHANGIKDLFSEIFTSINCGWRKPSKKIYQYAMDKIQCKPESVLFIGDDYINDYFTPKALGMVAILLDKEQKHTNLTSIKNFTELNEKIKSLS